MNGFKTIFKCRTIRFVPALFLTCCAIVARAVEDDHRLPITVFYSNQDPHWPAAEKLLAGIDAEYPALNIRKISIDDDTGYKQLADAEAKYNIKSPGELTIIVGSVCIVSKGDKREAERLLPSMMKRMAKPEVGKGRVEADLRSYITTAFGPSAKFSESGAEHKGLKTYAVSVDNKRIAWVVDAFRPIACPICNDVQFLISISLPEMKILDIKPVRELERYGSKLDDNETNGFLKKVISSQASNRVDADVITGATKTSDTYERLVNEILDEIKSREAQK